MIALTCAVVIGFLMIYIVPKVERDHSIRGTEIPGQLRAAINVSNHMVDYWYFWAIAFVVALGLFEWKCKRENKALIRTAIAAGSSVVWIVLLCWVVLAFLM